MNKERIFISQTGLAFKVRHRKSAIYFELLEKQEGYKFQFTMDNKTMAELLQHLELAAQESWKSIVIKEADSLGNDYDEYYSSEHDNNGYLSITEKGLFMERPVLDSFELYKFNKAKIGTFIYDLRERVAKKAA